MKDPYLYPGSEVLKNLADIHDEQELRNMEADYTLYRLSEIVTDMDWNRFDYEYKYPQEKESFHILFLRAFSF